MRFTIDYLLEIVSLFEELASCELDDVLKLIEVKRCFYDYSERVKKYHIWEFNLDKSEIKYLKNKKISEFPHEYEKLLLLMRRHFAFEIMPNVVLKPFSTLSYFRAKVDFALLKCEKKLGKLTTTFGYDPEKKALIHETKTVCNSIFVDQLKQAKNNINNLVKYKPSYQKRVLKVERNLVEEYFNNALRSYKAIIEKYFFEIRDYFLWYNKEIRVYIFDSPNNDIYRILISVYDSNKLKLSICPYKLTAYTMEFNNEEITNKIIYSSYTVIPKKAEQSQKDNDFIGLNINSPYLEILNRFWQLSKREEKKYFSILVFQTLGYNVTEIDGEAELLHASRIKMDIDVTKTIHGIYDNVKLLQQEGLFLYSPT